MRYLTAKREFRGSVSQVSAAAHSLSRQETVETELFQDTSHPESTCDPSDISHLDTHTPTTRSCAVSVTSSLADADLQITEGDNRVKRHSG